MKLETAGNVVGFPDVAARGAHVHKRKHGNEAAMGQDAKAGGFIALLRANVENAEQLVSTLEPGEEREGGTESDVSRREGMLDVTYFGTLLGAVETKIAAADLQDEPRPVVRIQPHAAPALKVIAREPLQAEADVPAPLAGSDTDVFLAAVPAMKEKSPSILVDDAAFEIPPGEDTPQGLRSENQRNDSPPGKPVADMTLSNVVREAVQQLPVYLAPLRKPAQDKQEAMSAPEVDDAPTTIAANVPDKAVERINPRAEQKSLRPNSGDASDDPTPQQTITQSLAADSEFSTQKPVERSPAQQIAENIRASLPPAAMEAMRAGAEQIRTLRIKLHPENLGEIEVSLKMRGDRIDVAIVAERGEAAQVLARSRDELRTGLTDAGLNLEMMDVSVMRPIRDAQASTTDFMQQGGGQSSLRQDPQQAGTFGNPSQGRSQAPRETTFGSEDGNGQVHHATEDTPVRQLRSGLFL